MAMASSEPLKARGALRHLGLVLLLLLTLVASAAAQQPDPKTRRAKALFEEGIALSDEGKWAEALGRFRQSDELVASPSVRYNIAVSLRALGRYVQARAVLQQIIEKAATAGTPLKPALLADVDKLLEQVKGKIVEIRVRVRPKGARLQLDGVTAEVDEDGHLELDPGQHVFTVSAKGYETTTVTRDLSASDKEISLAAARVKPSDTPQSAGGSTPVYESFWFWAIAGVVVVGATTAVILGRHGDEAPAVASPPPATVDRIIPTMVRF
jgi:hypothetical protein